MRPWSYERIQKQCNHALTARETVIQERQKFIKQYEKANPDLVKNFQQAITPKLEHSKVFKEMEVAVKYSCGHQHIFELLFDVHNLIQCETLMLRGQIHVDTTKHALFEHTNQQFLLIVQEDWSSLEQAHSKIIAPTQEESSNPFADSNAVPVRSI